LASEGGRGVPGPLWILKYVIFLWYFYQKKVVLSVSRGKNEISPFLAPLDKSLCLHLEKSTIAPPLEKIRPTPMSPF